MIRRQNRALTFLEIMIVVVMIGIMMAVVLPNLSGPREKIALQSAARDIAAGGLLARQMAIVSGRETKLIFRPEEKAWAMRYSEQEDTRRRRRNRDEEQEAQTSEEQDRELPERIEYAKFKLDDDELDIEEPQTLVFYPSGSSSGMAIQVKNGRDRALTIDFDKGTGRPEVYEGEPKSLAQKLREMGLDPAQFGLEEGFADAGSEAGAGFRMTAGWNEEERVDYYKDAVQRMLERSRANARVAEEGPGAYYSDASRWGGSQ